jgi:hypothetical protein
MPQWKDHGTDLYSTLDTQQSPIVTMDSGPNGTYQMLVLLIEASCTLVC